MISVGPLIAAAESAQAGAAPLAGKAAFIGVFTILLIWLLILPARFIGQAGVRIPWWRNVRYWAILVTIAQIGAYAWWS